MLHLYCKKVDQLSIKKNSWYKPMCSNKIFQHKNDRTTQITPSFDYYRKDCFAL